MPGSSPVMATVGVRLVKVRVGHGCRVQLAFTTANTYCGAGSGGAVKAAGRAASAQERPSAGRAWRDVHASCAPATRAAAGSKRAAAAAAGACPLANRPQTPRFSRARRLCPAASRAAQAPEPHLCERAGGGAGCGPAGARACGGGLGQPDGLACRRGEAQLVQALGALAVLADAGDRDIVLHSRRGVQLGQEGEEGMGAGALRRGCGLLGGQGGLRLR